MWPQSPGSKLIRIALALATLTSRCLVAASSSADCATTGRCEKASAARECSLEVERNLTDDTPPQPPPMQQSTQQQRAHRLSQTPVTRAELLKELHSPESLEYSETFFYKIESMHGKKTLAEFGRIALISKLAAVAYNDLLMHRYEQFSELKVSGGPEADQKLCLAQLREINERKETAVREKNNSTDMVINRLLDTYGRVPPGMFTGHGFWAGAYEECLKLKLDLSTNDQTSTRYCLAGLRHSLWPAKKTPLSSVSMLKCGVCLPKSCDSMYNKEKYELVMNLIRFNTRDIDKNEAQLADLYCLPDEQSPLRTWWRSPKALTTFTLLLTWCAVLIYSTLKHENLREMNPSENLTLKIYRSLSIVNNLKLLFDTSSSSSLLEAGKKMNKEDANKAESGREKHQENESERPKRMVDLRILEGIKVIGMCYVILGHVLMCLTLIIGNGREVVLTWSPAFLLANLVPAFAVNSFFNITGLLTSYLLFKQNQSHSFMNSPFKWIAFIFYRYIRIMPVYLIVVLFTKNLSKHMNTGPFWDYGTSSLAHRRTCEQESILWTVLFAANFKPPLDHCIPSAWYLANDFQFFIVTPIFLSALNKNPQIGKLLIKACILGGYLAGFLSIYNSELDDMIPIARFMPNGFKLYVTHLSFNYTYPIYRIPAYLCGLLIGHELYRFERNKIEFLTSIRQEAASVEATTREPDWSDRFKKYGVSLSLFFVSISVATPFVASRIPFSKHAARIAVSFIMPSYHVLFSLSVGLYILLATTGYGNHLVNRILSASFWKPFSRLSLCVVLVNVEVIMYIIHSFRKSVHYDNQFQISLNIFAILMTYLTAIVVCVLIEAPMRAALNHLLSYAFNKLSSPKNKKA